MRTSTRLFILLMINSLLLLSACAKPALQPPAGPAPAPQPTVTLRILTNGDFLVDMAIAAFQAEQPNVRVITHKLNAGDNLYEFLKTSLADGSIDLAYVPFGPMAASLALLPLDPLIQKSRFDLAPFGPLAAELRQDGRLSSLPVAIYPWVIAYNPALFESAGVAQPQPSWTWEDFRETAARLTSGEGDSKQWGFFGQWPVDLVELMAGPMAETDMARLRESYHLVATMIFTDQSASPGPDIDYSAAMQTGHDHLTLFGSGRAAMTLVRGVDLLLVDSRMQVKWELAPIPVHPGAAPAAPADLVAWGIGAGTAHPDLAWEFLRFLAGEPGGMMAATLSKPVAYRSPAVRQVWLSGGMEKPRSTEMLFTTDWYLRRGIDYKFEPLAKRALAGQLPWEEAWGEYLVRR